jgi:hypothetical protein
LTSIVFPVPTVPKRVSKDGGQRRGRRRTRRTVEQDTARRVDTDLTVEVELGEGKFDGFADFLLLNVHTSDVRVFAECRRSISAVQGQERKGKENAHIRFLIRSEHGNARVRLRGKNIDERVRVTVQRNGRTRLEEFAVDGAQNPNDVVTPRRRPNDSSVVIDRFEELSNHERYRLDALDFFLGSEKLSLEVAGLVFDVVLLEGEEFEVGFELGEFEEEVFVGGREGRVESGGVLNGGGEGRVLFRGGGGGR